MTDVVDLVWRGQVDAVVRALAGQSEVDRRRWGQEILADVKARRDTWWSGKEATALAVAAVGCLPGAAKAAELLGRRAVILADDVDPVLTVARERGVDWLPDLAYRLANKVRPASPWDGWRFIAGIVAQEKVAPPTTDTFVLGWLISVGWPPPPQRGVPLADRLRADPLLPSLLPRVFEVDGAGTRMDVQDYRTREPHALPRALASLAEDGTIDRRLLLDGCLGRLLRGDRAPALRPFVVLLEQLRPTPAEIGDRSTDFLRLLADAIPAAATMAQRALRTVPDLELDALLDASRAVLARPDKALVRSQLTWLDQVARKHPDRAAEIAAVIAGAFDHPAAEIRDKATALAAKHGYTRPAAVIVTAPGDDLPPPPPAAPVPPPVADPDELAQHLLTYLDTHSALSLELVLDGVVRLAGTDRDRLGEAVFPILARNAGASDFSWDPLSLGGVISGAMYSAADPQRAGAWRARWAELLAAARRHLLPGGTKPERRFPAPHRLLRYRLGEIGARSGGGPHPGLLAAPTMANGAIDVETLLARLAAYGDHEPWPWDFSQALLRLPPYVDEASAARAAALGTPTGDRLAAWLRAGGLPTPMFEVVTTERRARKPSYDWGYDRLPPWRAQVAVHPPGPVDDPVGFLDAPAPELDWTYFQWPRLWPAVLPGYRALVAAYLLPTVAASADLEVRDGATVLPLLAECTGPGGPATDLALAYGLGARHELDRAATVDALLALAATDGFDPAATGRHLGTLISGGRLVASRIIQPLRDAVSAGARLTVWRLLASALPDLLRQPTVARGTPDLLTLASEVATATGVRIDVPGLAEVAGRSGSARLVVEARRLATALTA